MLNTFALKSEQIKGADGKKYKIVAGVIRNEGAGFALISDTIHQSFNIESVSNDTTQIKITLPFTAKTIGSFVACPDETFAKLGLQMGSSVGTKDIYIQVYSSPQTIGGYISYNGTSWVVAVGATGNIVVQSFSSGILTLTHDSVGDLHTFSATPRNGGYTVKGGSISDTQSQVYFYDNAGNLVTTPDVNMKFYLARGSTSGSLKNPNTLTTAFSNIWVYGVFEV